LLALVAIGLFLDAAATITRPVLARSQDLMSIKNDLSLVSSYLQDIARGECDDKKIC
jgi:hypothetical protein